MLPGVLALVGRSLRVDARQGYSHLARLGLMLAIYISVCVALFTGSMVGAPGLQFFRGISYLNLVFMSLVGISFFSTSISEEREEETLGLMLMAGISPLGILVGKSVGRLVQAMLLVAVQYPFTLLAVTMGGVTQSQVAAAFVALLAYMVFLFGVGLLCSTIGTSNRSAATWMILGLSTYLLVPLCALAIVTFLIRNGMTGAELKQNWLLVLLDYVSRVSVFQQMSTILVTGFAESRFGIQVVSNVVLGLLGFLCAWGLFGVCANRPSVGADSRGLVARARGRLRWLSPGRAWGNPFLWKDCYFVAGGLGMVPIRIAFCIGLYVVAILQSVAFGMGPPGQAVDISFYQVFLSLAVAIDAGWLMARSLHDEVRGQTLASLLMTPHTLLLVVYSKFAGALLGCLPGLAVDLFVSVATHEGRRNFIWVITEPLGFCVTAYFLLIPNLAAVLSLYLRWGAVPLAVALVVGIHVAMMLTMRQTGDNAMFMMGLVINGVSVACHGVILYRIRKLSTA